MSSDNLPDSKATADATKHRMPSFYFKQLAQEAVAGMEGVRQVVNAIGVVW
jgi:hypothetical protein